MNPRERIVPRQKLLIILKEEILRIKSIRPWTTKEPDNETSRACDLNSSENLTDTSYSRTLIIHRHDHLKSNFIINQTNRLTQRRIEISHCENSRWLWNWLSNRSIHTTVDFTVMINACARCYNPQMAIFYFTSFICLNKKDIRHSNNIQHLQTIVLYDTPYLVLVKETKLILNREAQQINAEFQFSIISWKLPASESLEHNHYSIQLFHKILLWWKKNRQSLQNSCILYSIEKASFTHH